MTEEEVAAKRALEEAAANEAADLEAAAGSALAFAAASVDACATLAAAMLGGVAAPYEEEEEEGMQVPLDPDSSKSFLGDVSGVVGLFPDPENME